MTHLRRLGLFIASLALGGAIALGSASLGGCVTAPDGSVDVKSSSQQYNNRAAQLIQGVTAVRRAATALLRAGKITATEDEALQSQLDALHVAVIAGQALYATDPAAAQAKIDRAASELARLKTSTGVPQ